MVMMGIFRAAANKPEIRELLVQILYKLNILLNTEVIIPIRYQFMDITGKRPCTGTKFYNNMFGYPLRASKLDAVLSVTVFL